MKIKELKKLLDQFDDEAETSILCPEGGEADIIAVSWFHDARYGNTFDRVLISIDTPLR